MKVSAYYARWENGALGTVPGPLPDSWGGHLYLTQWTDEKLASIGWYPVEGTCPKCSKHLRYRLDEERKAIIAYVPSSEIERTKQAITKSSERMLEQPQHIGFISAALGASHYYSSSLHFIMPIIAASIVGAKTKIWCHLDADDSGAFREHTGDQAKVVLLDFLAHYDDIVVPHITETLVEIRHSSTVEEVEDAHNSVLDFMKIWQKSVGFS